MPSRRPRKSAGAQPHAQPPDAHATALAWLARRDLSAAELAARLGSRGFDAGAVEGVISELRSSGALNDARYAEHYVAWHSARGQGPVRIAAELRRQKVSEPAIEAALATGPDWHALARRVWCAKFGPQRPRSWAEKARQARFLQYRGFSADHIRMALGADPDLD